MKNELFIIPPDTISAAFRDKDSLHATVDALKQCNLLSLPYPKVDIQVCIQYAKEFTLPKGTPLEDLEDVFAGRTGYVELAPEPSGAYCILHGLDINGDFDQLTFEFTAPKFKPGFVRSSGDMERKSNLPISKTLAYLLVVLLATKNSVRVTKQHKLAKLGIGPKRGHKSYPRVTTISLPSTLPACEEHPPTGRTVTPHLRRGHIRHQKYGPKLAFTRAILIEPCFVNADADFVSARKAYNLSFSQNPLKPERLPK